MKSVNSKIGGDILGRAAYYEKEGKGLLRELSIRNFAIIDDLTVSFAEGLTVLTGETGAGKSIIIDAVNILAGGRGSTEFIRHGEKKAELGGEPDAYWQGECSCS